MKIISFLLLSSISINAVSATIAEKIRTQNPEQLDQIAKQVAGSIAAELPIRINKDSTITSVMYMKNTKTFMYFYAVINIENPISFKKDAVAWACTDPIMSAFMDKGIRYKYIYANHEGKQMGSYYVTMNDC